MIRTWSNTRPITSIALGSPHARKLDRETFAQLYDSYVDKVYRYIYYKVGSTTQAEDLTAQVFMKAWQARGRYRWTERPFSAWLFRIAHNLVVDHFRTSHESVPIDDLPLFEYAGNVEELAEQHLDSEMLRDALKQLTDDQQQVILLKFIEGYNTGEVAEIMERGVTAVRALQHRALLSLHRILTSRHSTNRAFA